MSNLLEVERDKDGTRLFINGTRIFNVHLWELVGEHGHLRDDPPHYIGAKQATVEFGVQGPKSRHNQVKPFANQSAFRINGVVVDILDAEMVSHTDPNRHYDVTTIKMTIPVREIEPSGELGVDASDWVIHRDGTYKPR